MKTLLPALFLGLITLISSPVWSASTKNNMNYSGTYQCTGKDAHDGAYKAKVKLQLDKTQSPSPYAAYHFSMEVEGYGKYQGAAAGAGDMLSITFANEDAKTQDFGTGLAKVHRGDDGSISFDKFYYEADYKRGNHGTEHCVRISKEVI